MSEAPISLYIDLKKDQTADLEVVARASLAFAAAIKEAAFILDPSAKIRIELASGTQGSLSLNSVIKLVSQHAKLDRLTIKTIAVVTLLWLSKEVGGWTVSKIMDLIVQSTPQEISKQLSDEDIKKIAESVFMVIEKKVGKPQIKEVYAELEKDHAISGVGVTFVPGAVPDNIVPRELFESRVAEPDIVEEEFSKRRTTTPEKVVVIKSVLRTGDGHWRFLLNGETFGAPIKDQDFLENLLSGRIHIPMRAGIELDVILEKVEEKVDGLWVIIERNVLKVSGVHTPDDDQESLSFPISK
jgi:hypothetical protein